MTSFLSPGNGSSIGGRPPSTDTRALQEINSRDKSYANKDFVKNIAFLNNSVDVLSQWSQKLQSGVDQANENVIEQVQGFAADLFVLFAGLEPTGIELGDLKYVIQAIGALLGVNPDTPFPMNLIEAARHFFTTYIVPLDQFTDVIFDSINAWALELGFTQEFVDSLKELQSALSELGHTIQDFFDAISDLITAFGGFGSINQIGEIWDALVDLFGGLDSKPLKPVFEILSQLGVPFINSLTFIVKSANSFLTPLSVISAGQIKNLGDNVVPKPSNDTTVWSVGGNSSNAWKYDATQSSSSKSAGSFTTLGNGLTKRVLTQTIQKCSPNQKFTANFMAKWQGIPVAGTTTPPGQGNSGAIKLPAELPAKFSGTTTTPTAAPAASNNDGSGYLSMIVVWFTDANEVSVSRISIPANHVATSDWQDIAGNFTVPQNINGFKVGLEISERVTSGQVWGDDLAQQVQGTLNQNLITGLVETLTHFPSGNLFGFLPTNIIPGFDASKIISGNFSLERLPDTVLNTIQGVASSLLFGLIPTNLFSGFDATKIISGQLSQGKVVGLPDLTSNFGNFLMNLFGGLTNTVPGTSGLSLTGIVDTILGVVKAIPSTNVSGVGGPLDLFGTINSIFNNLVGGFVGKPGTGATLPDLYNIGQIVSSNASKGNMALGIVGIRDNQSLNTGFLATSESNFSFDKIALQSPVPTISISQSTALMMFIRANKSADKAVISWQGYGKSNVTDCYVNVYKMNVQTGELALVHSSANVVSILNSASAANPIIYNMPSSIHVEPGEIYGIEISVRGSGSTNIAGVTSAMADQLVYPKRWAAVRNSGTSAPPPAIAAPTYSNNVGWFEWGITAVAIPGASNVSSGDTKVYNKAGSTNDIPIPASVNNVDALALPGGGSGRFAGERGINGRGGGAGVWVKTRWKRGVDFSGNAKLNLSVGAGGVGGGAGGASQVQISAGAIGSGSSNLSSGTAPGSSDIANSPTDYYGRSPGGTNWQGVDYAGGEQQQTYGAKGISPGGGGAGGGGQTPYQDGGAGADGVVILVFS